jgi:hypothetical protein
MTGGVAGTAHAVPGLQLDIIPGSYDSISKDSLPADGATSFDLYKYWTVKKGDVPDFGQVFYLSIALTPPQKDQGEGNGPDLGSFDHNGDTYAVVGDMVYGNPPIENLAYLQPHDGQDLGRHSVFPTYFLEVEVKFTADQAIMDYNVAETDVDNFGDTSTVNYTAGDSAPKGVMFWEKDTFDVANLADGYGLHFDLYTKTAKACSSALEDGGVVPSECTDVDREDFAPFSKDASYVPGDNNVPEPGTLGVLSVGLACLGWAARRRRKAA